MIEGVRTAAVQNSIESFQDCAAQRPTRALLELGLLLGGHGPLGRRFPTFQGALHEVLVVGLGAHLLREPLAQAQPGGHCHGVGLEGGGLAESHRRGGPDALPFLDAGDAEEVEEGPHLLSAGFAFRDAA